jgi:antibiotic biosynthesis monooxygenase (ABM) superfamily enzyme
MNLFTDVEIGKLSLVLIVLIAFFSLEVLKSNAVPPLLPRRLRRWLREWNRRDQR